jgi:hypothetical protein
VSTDAEKRVGVIVTAHVVNRMLERRLVTGAREQVTARVYAEVQTAIRMGRIAKTKPRWAAGENGRRTKGHATTRFVWPCTRDYVYVVARATATGLGRRSEYDRALGGENRDGAPRLNRIPMRVPLPSPRGRHRSRGARRRGHPP